MKEKAKFVRGYGVKKGGKRGAGSGGSHVHPTWARKLFSHVVLRMNSIKVFWLWHLKSLNFSGALVRSAAICVHLLKFRLTVDV